MSNPLPERIQRFLEATAPTPDAVLEEMDAHAREQGFPHVGPAVGGVLRVLASAVGARRVFEFGSGFGYSAYWFAAALPADGELVLTEFDRKKLDRARAFMTRGAFDAAVRYEPGDAMETVERYDGPFDIVLLDHENGRYPAAFETVRDDIPVGGLVVADNVIAAGDTDFESLLALLEGDGPDEVDPSTGGIASYLDLVRDDPAFETAVLPIGEGIAVSVRRE